MHGCEVTLKFKEAELLESVSPCCDSEVEYGNVYFMLMIQSRVPREDLYLGYGAYQPTNDHLAKAGVPVMGADP